MYFLAYFIAVTSKVRYFYAVNAPLLTKSKNFLNFSKGDKCEYLFLTYCIRNIEAQSCSK